MFAGLGELFSAVADAMHVVLVRFIRFEFVGGPLYEDLVRVSMSFGITILSVKQYL